MSNPSMTGVLTTWAIELSEFEVSYVPRTSVKVQALADFIVECTARVPEEVLGPREGKPEEIPRWKLYVAEASNEKGSGAGILIEGPEGEVREHPIHMDCNILPVLEEVADGQSSIARYLVYEELPSDKLEAKKVVNRSYKF
ncbi:hypothetical protein LIER_29920 [Lithospermum erythrorhizon]|uniref:Uncharacterized protein n=1 Tax=Lithospermum erythrorhizon TaxID=34254 RepID=A0AAV3RKS1_LITER